MATGKTLELRKIKPTLRVIKPMPRSARLRSQVRPRVIDLPKGIYMLAALRRMGER